MDEVEGHPIPQDITGFQFRLIGDMTIKQFAYLAASAVIAWFFFSIPLPLIIRLPLAGCFAFIGIVLAFIPIHGRPADTMIVLFLKAVFKPNQFVKNISDEDLSQTIAIPKPIEEQGVKIPVPEPIRTTVSTPTKAYPETQTSNQPSATQIIIKEEKEHELQQELQKAVSEKDELEKKLKEMEEKITLQSKTAQAPTAPLPAQTFHIKEIEQTPRSSVVIPLIPTDEPNLVYGVVKDPRENILSNILVEVKDQDGNPVRAFKTNPLGQFASATSLPDGIYTISFEDPKKKQQFTPIQLQASGKPLPPLIIVSIDEREELRKSLFQQQNYAQTNQS